jgi:hypothetical protein
MLDKPQPRHQYHFGSMKENEVKRIRVPEDDPTAGMHARGAAYAYGRRNDWDFCGEHVTIKGKVWMLIRRIR